MSSPVTFVYVPRVPDHRVPIVLIPREIFVRERSTNLLAIEIDDDLSPNHRNIVKKIMDRVRQPRNYGPTPEEQEIAKRNEITEREKREREEREERERNEEEAANDRAKKQKDWTTKLEQIKREEFQMLDAQSTPLRNYLMTHVMPTLTKALIGKHT